LDVSARESRATVRLLQGISKKKPCAAQLVLSMPVKLAWLLAGEYVE
jgi:hypothetical protein